MSFGRLASMIGTKYVPAPHTITMGVVYANSEPDIRSSLRNKILESATEDQSQKPWTLVNSVTEEPSFSEDEARKALKKLMLEGELQIASTGEVRATSSSV